MADTRKPLLVWGCDPRRQLEAAWLHALLGPLPAIPAWEGGIELPLDEPPAVVLIESGLMRLERSPDPQRLNLQHQQRKQRLDALSRIPRLGLIHLSDEEGLDGKAFYPLLPDQVVIWRNFPYASLGGTRAFPIGPRAEFLDEDIALQAMKPASRRCFPWAFMGTLWTSGSRTLAASLFMKTIPQGFFFGGTRFGCGLPLPVYRQNLLDSAFALCPEGDRHLDTFRLYESLQAGCIPVLVDQRTMAAGLLGDLAPWPVFVNWPQALGWVQHLLARPDEMDATQQAIAAWWLRRKESLGIAMRHTLHIPLA